MSLFRPSSSSNELRHIKTAVLPFPGTNAQRHRFPFLDFPPTVQSHSLRLCLIYQSFPKIFSPFPIPVDVASTGFSTLTPSSSSSAPGFSTSTPSSSSRSLWIPSPFAVFPTFSFSGFCSAATAEAAVSASTFMVLSPKGLASLGASTSLVLAVESIVEEARLGWGFSTASQSLSSSMLMFSEEEGINFCFLVVDEGCNVVVARDCVLSVDGDGSSSRSWSTAVEWVGSSEPVGGKTLLGRKDRVSDCF